jgi:hypothetical protein
MKLNHVVQNKKQLILDWKSRWLRSHRFFISISKQNIIICKKTVTFEIWTFFPCIPNLIKIFTKSNFFQQITKCVVCISIASYEGCTFIAMQIFGRKQNLLQFFQYHILIQTWTTFGLLLWPQTTQTLMYSAYLFEMNTHIKGKSIIFSPWALKNNFFDPPWDLGWTSLL